MGERGRRGAAKSSQRQHGNHFSIERDPQGCGGVMVPEGDQEELEGVSGIGHRTKKHSAKH